jgi:hypothetical protein
MVVDTFVCHYKIRNWLFRNNLCDTDNVYHTDFAYHSDICRSVSMFHTNFFTPVATHGHSPSTKIEKGEKETSCKFVADVSRKIMRETNKSSINNEELLIYNTI